MRNFKEKTKLNLYWRINVWLNVTQLQMVYVKKILMDRFELTEQEALYIIDWYEDQEYRFEDNLG